MANPDQQTDPWSASAYDSAAPFVPKLTSTVISYLSPAPTDRILDLGCGDGVLTKDIAAMVPRGAVLGLDASANMIAGAKENSAASNCSYRVQDCTLLLQDEHGDVLTGDYDKVFSNAAMHWILREEPARAGFFQAVHKALKPDGLFVFEQGGAGNVAEVQTACVAALVAHGVPAARAVSLSPWFFPTETWMRSTLQENGFVVERLESEYRPSQLTANNDQGTGGLQGWVKLMCAAYLEAVPAGEERQQVLEWLVRVLEPVVTREDRTRHLGYVRLRGVARKKRL